MPTREEMAELVAAHRDLDEPMDAAIWIKHDDPFAWLVEVLPGFRDDKRVARPLVFTPSRDFPYALHLIAGNLNNLREAIQEDRVLAEQLAGGEVLYESQDEGSQLIALARKASNGAR